VQQQISQGWLTPRPVKLCTRHTPPVPKGRVGVKRPEWRCPVCQAAHQRRQYAQDLERSREKQRRRRHNRERLSGPLVRPQPSGPAPTCKRGHEKVWRAWPSGSRYACPVCQQERDHRHRAHETKGERRERHQRDAERGRLNRVVKRIAAQLEAGRG